MSQWKPNLIVVDFETTGLEYYRKDFKVVSMAMAWRDKHNEVKTWYSDNLESIETALSKVADQGIPLVAHNVQFEMGVSKCAFPHLDLNWTWCTLRLSQLRDGGGNEFDYARQASTLEELEAELDGETVKPWRKGLGLEACASRFLSEDFQEHKKPFYDYLRSKGYKRPGEALDKLPPDMLRNYNVADVEVELELFESNMRFFELEKFDPSFDHMLYLHRCKRASNSKIKGTKVNRGWLGFGVHFLKEETIKINNHFREFNGRNLLEFEEERMWNFILYGKASGKGNPVSERTADRTWANRFEKMAREPEKYKFNPRSTSQLKAFFMGKLGLVPQFITKTGNDKIKTWTGTIQELKNQYPSFSAAHLPSWGESGEILKNIKRKQIVMKQAENLVYLSSYDGRWHISIRSAGTKTNRLAANEQGGL